MASASDQPVDVARLRMSLGQFSGLIATIVGGALALLLRIGSLEAKIEVLAERDSGRAALNEQWKQTLTRAFDDLRTDHGGRLRVVEERVNELKGR